MKTIEALNFQMIDVADLQPIKNNAKYPPELIENLALAIIQAGGLISPLLVMQTGLQEYKLLDEYSQALEYLAIKRAKEINPRACEMVNAFICSGDARASALQQLDIIKNIPRHCR